MLANFGASSPVAPFDQFVSLYYEIDYIRYRLTVSGAVLLFLLFYPVPKILHVIVLNI